MRPARWPVAVATVVVMLVTGVSGPATAAPAPGGLSVLAGLDLSRVTVLDLQRAMDHRWLTSTGLTAIYLARIRLLDPKLNAVIGTNPDALRDAAVSEGVDPDDAATAAAGPYARRNYLRTLDADALRGKRIGVWRGGGAEQEDVAPVLTATIATLRAQGATVVDDVELPGLDEAFANEFPALLHEFKHDINAYLAARPGPHPGTLAGLIEFNRRNAETELRYFGQDIFEAAEATSGDLTDPAYVRARTTATTSAQRAIDTAVATHDLDAIVAPTNGPAWVTDLQNGDDFTEFVGSSGAAAVAGYPNVTVPAGQADGVLPLGMSFFGTKWSEPALMSFAYDFEQATQARRNPRYLPTL